MGLPENKELYDSLPAEKKAKAIHFLHNLLGPSGAIKLLRSWIKADPMDWFVKNRRHFTWGMAMRNVLRKANYGEKFFGINNMDDIYVELVEEAVRDT